MKKNDLMAILLTDEAGERHWRLGPFPAGDGLGVMLGWTLEDPEGGVPKSVARAFARAMVRFGRVTFPCSSRPSTKGDEWRRRGEDEVAPASLWSMSLPNTRRSVQCSGVHS